MTTTRATLSRHAPAAKAMDDMLKRPAAFTMFLADGRACLSDHAAERSLSPAALGRRAWLFAGSEQGGHRAAAVYTLIGTAKLNGVDPQAWLADLLERMAAWPASRLHQLAPRTRHADQPGGALGGGRRILCVVDEFAALPFGSTAACATSVSTRSCSRRWPNSER
jgi:hypothetical protein